MDTTEQVDNVQDVHEMPDEEVVDKEEVPTKCVSTVQSFQINCSVKYIDFEGRTDGESIMKLTSQLKPRRMILVRGSEENISAMKNFCKDIIPGENMIFTPKNGEIVDATTERYIYQVKLRDSLFSSLSFSQAKEGHLAWVDGMISLAEEEKTDIVNTSNNDGEDVVTNPVIPVLVSLQVGFDQGGDSVTVPTWELGLWSQLQCTGEE